jgi:WD40 repeat protein
LAAAGSDGPVYLFDMASGEFLQKLMGHTGKIWCMKFSPDSRLLATGGADKEIRLWQMEGQHVPRVLHGNADPYVRSLDFTPDGRTLLSGSRSGVEIWDIATGSLSETLTTNAASVVLLSPDGKYLAYGDITSGVKLMDWKTRRDVARLLGHRGSTYYGGSIYGGSFSADGKTFATASWDGTTKLWRVPTGQLLLTIPTQFGVTWSAPFSPDGRWLATGSGSSMGGEVRLLRAATQAETAAVSPSVPKVTRPKSNLVRWTMEAEVPADEEERLADMRKQQQDFAEKGWLVLSVRTIRREDGTSFRRWELEVKTNAASASNSAPVASGYWPGR